MGQIHFGSGDNVSGNKIINERKLFSDSQFIRRLPPSMGGSTTLNLDNVATLISHVPYSNNSITLLLDVVPFSMPDRRDETMTIEGMQCYNHTTGVKYIFDTQHSKRHEMTINGRTFIVTLQRISQLEVQSCPGAIEYQFGISEKN